VTNLAKEFRLDGEWATIEGETQKRFIIERREDSFFLSGVNDENFKLMEAALGVKIIARGNEVLISGESHDVDSAIKILEDLVALFKRDNSLSTRDVWHALGSLKGKKNLDFKDILSDIVQITARGKQIKPKTLGQKVYVDAMRKNDIVFGIGPAGTGKTYLAVAMATAALNAKEFNRLILTRPAVEAGERLGFLPGDLQEKVNPYLRPLYDALYDILGAEVFAKYMERGIIEVAPLAYMRGRTLDDSFVILDEAQNTTEEQMKMFLTRLGFGSKAVVTGDITQIDLPSGKTSGLTRVQSILKGIKGIEFVYFTETDVVRHPLVQKIVKAYEKYENANGQG
jgi:phosphate starvation-inducible PhoH-like protein